MCMLTGGTPVPSRVGGFVMGRPAGTVRVVPIDATADGRAARVVITRGSALGMPFVCDGEAQRAVKAYAHACACIAGDFDAEVATALGVRHDRQSAPGGRHARENAIRDIVELLEEGRDVLLACDCGRTGTEPAGRGTQRDVSGAACHGAIIAATAEQRLWQQREAEARPPDPVE
eukprot:2521446-Pleurochrysis_carterae.AAC.1